jgi:hypothetical protein
MSTFDLVHIPTQYNESCENLPVKVGVGNDGTKRLSKSNQGELDGQGMWHAWERGKSVQDFGGKARNKETT